MASEIIMPRLSDSMEEGVVLAWLVEVGNDVRVGAELVEIETDKATMAYEAEEAGTLLSILVGAGESAPVGAPIAMLGTPGEVPTSRNGGGATDAVAAAVPAVPVLAPVAAEPASAAARNNRVAATPVARRLAAAHGIELVPLSGTGPNGRIVKSDVLRAAAQPATAADGAPDDGLVPGDAVPATPPEPRSAAPEARTDDSRGGGVTTELSRLQRLVARRMSDSRATVPDFEVRVNVDMGACGELRSQLKSVTERPPSFNDMILKASALALRDHPRANGSYTEDGFEIHQRVNIGIAVATDDALVVPTVFDADRASLGEIARTTRTLAAKVRDGSITPPELAGGTFTVSNLGMFGIDQFSAVINPPQAAILAVGAIRKRPVVTADETIVARPMMTLALAADHRILYGADAARLVSRIRELLEEPLTLALL
jgi:pyruvate dehydrogenase E2 component (dihydrolipoamide acetyltransferase)